MPMNIHRKVIPSQGRKVTCKRAKAISKKLKWLLIQYINMLYPKLKANRIIQPFLRLSQIEIMRTARTLHACPYSVRGVCLFEPTVDARRG